MAQNPNYPITFQYDDSFLEIMDKVNEALKKHGLVFESDEQAHDGFECYRLQKQ